MVHDIAYRYGFTEEAGNFQVTNFENGGKGGDRVELTVQDGGGLNNANFATPPEYVSSRNT
jgi:extracellular elastinolytic metalloproteinase